MSHPPTPDTAAPPPSPPAPIASYLAQPRPGISIDGAYVVLPRAVIEALPAPVQHQMVLALRAVHTTAHGAPWPQGYRVHALEWSHPSDLDDTALAEAGILTELDGTGELIYRDARTLQPLEEPDLRRAVPVTVPDPLHAMSPAPSAAAHPTGLPIA